jgi:hypothetical protein
VPVRAEAHGGIGECPTQRATAVLGRVGALAAEDVGVVQVQHHNGIYQRVLSTGNDALCYLTQVPPTVSLVHFSYSVTTSLSSQALPLWHKRQHINTLLF